MTHDPLQQGARIEPPGALLRALPAEARCAFAAELLQAAPATARPQLLCAIRPHLHPQALDMLLDALQPLPGLPAALPGRAVQTRIPDSAQHSL